MASTLSWRVASAIFSRLQPGRISHVQSLCSRCLTTEMKENQNSTPEANTSKSENEATEKEAEGKLLAEKEKLENQIKDVTDKYKRALAETENVRQRFRKQLEESKLYAVQGFCKDLLEVADILGTATSSVPQEELDKNEHLKGLFNGLLMTESQLQKVFQKNNLFKIDPLNEKFDPNFHEAMFEVPAPDKEAGTVCSSNQDRIQVAQQNIEAGTGGSHKRTIVTGPGYPEMVNQSPLRRAINSLHVDEE